MIISAFSKTLGQLGDPRFRRVLLLGIGCALLLLGVIYAVFVTLVGWFTPDVVTLPLVGEVRWIDDLTSWGSAILMFLLSVFLMVPVASAMTGIFVEDVAQAVEDKHYPSLPAAQKVSLADTLRDTGVFLGVLIGANIVALILYIIFSPFALFIFWGLNGFLLGREYFTMAAMRRVGRAEAKAMRRRHMPTIWAAGTLMAMPLSVPLINLVIPILGAATFTHLFHQLRRKTGSGY